MKRMVLIMKNYVHNYKYFYGVEITEEEIKNGWINYRTLAKTFDAVMCNDITKLFFADINGVYSEPELYNGSDYNEEDDYYYDIYQYFIIDRNGVDILCSCTDEIIYYLPELDLYVWGVTHFGTPWNGVNTDIKIELEVE
jgi:hypothetical protein